MFRRSAEFSQLLQISRLSQLPQRSTRSGQIRDFEMDMLYLEDDKAELGIADDDGQKGKIDEMMLMTSESI